MKKLLLVTLICASGIFAFAQTQIVKTTTRKTTVDRNSVVIDSAGMQYPYAVWQKLMSSGNYILRQQNPGSDSTAFLLVKLDESAKKLMINRMSKPMESKFFTTGQKIKSFSAKDMKGYKVKLQDLVGKVVVLNFWFIGCPPCRQEIPELNKMALDYAGDPNVVFVAVCLDNYGDIKDFVKDNPFSYHIIDDGRSIADIYGINLYPTNIVLDKEGKVQFHSSGYGMNTPYWIRKTIDEAKM